ncbi:pyridine nucleotide-disulfide oxidoreductase family protein [Mycobacterium kansasii]|uniref:Pyridine nucleotide-disulfide oxidoreductase family protein n=1 Tax=Mycobacterium kansasii TaxID=1768 RepID=A0A1V3XG39_MYCKA|nr:pyridine nucleotide-disulfide oxidoreductase family protein [Mycobacterium kansasii]
MASAKTVVVVGHGMVGHRFVEALRDRDRDNQWRVTVLCEEPTPAYDRVALSSYVSNWDREALALAGNDYTGDSLVELRVGERATVIDRDSRMVTTSAGARIGYDALVLATGSYPFVRRSRVTIWIAASFTARWMISTRSGRSPSRGRRGWWSVAVCSVWRPPTHFACSV